MNKLYKTLILLISLFIFVDKVNAEDSVYARDWVTNDANEVARYQELESKFSSSTYRKYQVVGQDNQIFLYGKLECNFNTNSCTYVYQGNTMDFEKILQQNVICTGGEKYLEYHLQADPGKNYKEEFNGGNEILPDNYTKKEKAPVYWSKQFFVKCTNEVASETYVDLSNELTTTTPSNGNYNESPTVQEDSSYNSSTTETSPETGVETYYIILGLVAILSYVIMSYVKKHNLFKNI